MLPKIQMVNRHMKDVQWKDAILNDAAFSAYDAGNFFFNL